MKKLSKDNKGFTLVEMIVVLVILAILAAILIPGLLGYIDDAKDKQLEIHGKAVYTAAQSVASKFYGTNKNPSEGSKTTGNQKDYIDKVRELSEISSFSGSATIYFEGSTGRDAYKVRGIKYSESGNDRYLVTGTSEWSKTDPGVASSSGYSIPLQ